MSEKRNIFVECRETVEQIGKANGKEGKAAAALEFLAMSSLPDVE